MPGGLSLGAISTISIGNVALLAGTGVVLADIVPLPEGWSNWPATAILGFITLATLGVLVMKLRQEVSIQKESSQSIMALAVALSKATDSQSATNDKLDLVATAMMSRPCLLEKE